MASPSNISMLLVVGHHTFGTQEVNLLHYGSLYHLFFHKQIDFRTCSVVNSFELSNYITAYSLEEFDVVYLVYVGHGEGKNDFEYPFICPGAGSFDITSPQVKNRKGTKIKFRIILDCFNIGDMGVGRSQPAALSAEANVQLDAFLNLDFQYISLRKGLLGFGSGTSTPFNEALLSTILNYRYATIEEFLGLFNFEVQSKMQEGRYGGSTTTWIKKFISSSPEMKVLDENCVMRHKKEQTLEVKNRYIVGQLTMQYIDFHGQRQSSKDVFDGALGWICF